MHKDDIYLVFHLEKKNFNTLGTAHIASFSTLSSVYICAIAYIY